MKKFLLSIFALATLTACETVDEADRWTEPTPIEMKKNVLVEDFTGQNCVNCPGAASLLHDLSASSMGEHIVAVSIHGGALAMGVDKSPLGLATEIGEDYNTHFGVQAWPSGMIDRTNGSGVIGKTADVPSWTAGIVAQLGKELLVDLTANTTFNAETRELHVDVTAVGTEGHSITADMKLTVWLTESGIEGFQKYSDHNDTKYIHNHVLRAALSDPYGDVLATIINTASSERGVHAGYTYTIPATYGRNKWAFNPEKMAVVAFVTDKNGEVLQVIDVPVVK